MHKSNFTKAATILGALGIFTPPASAHRADLQDYAGYVNQAQQECCNNKDCRPLKSNEYGLNPDGTVTIKPMDGIKHPTTIGPNDFQVTPRKSIDGKYHVCVAVVWSTAREVRCLITPREDIAGPAKDETKSIAAFSPAPWPRGVLPALIPMCSPK